MRIAFRHQILQGRKTSLRAGNIPNTPKPLHPPGDDVLFASGHVGLIAKRVLIVKASRERQLPISFARCLAMIFESTVGDTYGAGFEYADQNMPHNKAEYFVPHPVHDLPDGRYTDDTQMTLAIAEAMVEDDPWTPESLAERFVNVFKRDERPGYAGGFYLFLQSVKDGADFLARMRPDSDKSGAAMRAAPIGLYANVHEVIRRSTIQARLTHNTELGIAAANAAALLSHYFAYDLGPQEHVGYFLNAYVPLPHLDWSTDYVGKVRSKGWMSVHAAVTVVRRAKSLKDVLIDSVAFTGDVDTVATIAMAAASFSPDIDKSIPQALIDTMENGTYGKDYIKQLDDRLLKKFT